MEDQNTKREVLKQVESDAIKDQYRLLIIAMEQKIIALEQKNNPKFRSGDLKIPRSYKKGVPFGTKPLLETKLCHN